MSASLTKTKRRIQSVESTKKITKAMNLVATVKLKKWRNSMDNIISYLNMMEGIVLSCVEGADTQDNDIEEFKKYKGVDKTLYVVVTSSLGLCGGYNYNLFKFLNTKLKANDKVIILGTKGFTKLSHEDLDLDEDYVSFLDKMNYPSVDKLRMTILKEYKSGQYKSVKLITTLYKNSLKFIPNDITILPLGDISEGKEKVNVDTIFEPNEKEVLSLIIPKYINTVLYGRLTEAVVCEQASRRNAMDTATDNAEELTDKLKIEYNKARQAAITQEITEVVSGAINK